MITRRGLLAGILASAAAPDGDTVALCLRVGPFGEFSPGTVDRMQMLYSDHFSADDLVAALRFAPYPPTKIGPLFK